MPTCKSVDLILGSQPANLDSNVGEVLRQMVEAAMADKRPSVLAEEVFKRLRGRHRRRVTAKDNAD